MSDTWGTRLRGHQIWPVVESVAETANGIQLPPGTPDADALSRILWLCAALSAHRDVEDARAYTPAMLETALSPLQSGVQASLNQFATEPTTYPDSLRVAGEQVDAVVTAMASWPPLSQKGNAISAGQAAAAYEKAAKAALDDLTDRVAKLDAALGDLVSQSEGSAKAQVTANDAAIQALIDDTRQSATKMGETIEELRVDAEATLGRMKDLEGQGDNIVARIASKAVADDYAADARRKAAAGWVWDLFGVGIGLVFGGLLLQHLFASDAPTDSVPLGLTRLAVSIGGLGLAALCFARGRGNHIEARRSKRAHLRLSTAGPFVANLDEEFQDVVLEGMADRIYLQGIVDEDLNKRYDDGLVEKVRARIRARRSPGDEAS